MNVKKRGIGHHKMPPRVIPILMNIKILILFFRQISSSLTNLNEVGCKWGCRVLFLTKYPFMCSWNFELV